MRLITGAVQNYPWGSRSALPQLLQASPTGEPWAEYWLGAHPLGPASLADGSEQTLADLVESRPEVVGAASVERFGPQLPYLFKLLSANQPLSLQAHPTREQAAIGFAREEAAGIPLEAPERTYKDSWPKPELLVALTPFEALAGFRCPRRSAELFAQLPVKSSLDSIISPLTERSGPAALAEVFLDVLSLGADRRHLVEEIVAAAVPLMPSEGELGVFARTAVELDEHFPGDPSIVAALLLNRVHLQPGQALFASAGTMHAYLRGTAVEVMANSDNVLRGGLTKKHIDVDGLITVVNFAEEDIRPITLEGSDGLYRYPTPAPEFELWVAEPTSADPLTLPLSERGRILFVHKGEHQVTRGEQSLGVSQGQSVFLEAGETVSVRGSGRLFLVGPGV
ncbi:MAG: mannose-6-phosphate isomerase, class I [Propionibacteriaceae bacterium]|nr:mannose-6-phosphate isomerase, class I [Propionibacteriaceae bacterium]